MRRRSIQAILFIIGCWHSAVAVLAFLAPQWFFTHVSRFPPYNAHFLADIGAFTAPLGVGLLLAARAPERHRTLIGLAALATVLHAISHLRDLPLHLPPHMDIAAGLLQEAVILLAGLALLIIALGGARATGHVMAHAEGGNVCNESS